MRNLIFTLPFALPSANVRQRKHWAELMRAQRTLSQEVMAAIGGPRHFPRPPFQRARVTVLRCSPGMLDTDNLYASVKPLADVLCINSARHTVGLGIIEDDNPKQCELIASQVACKLGGSATVVKIEELDPLPLLAPKRRSASGSKRPSLAQIATGIRFGARAAA